MRYVSFLVSFDAILFGYAGTSQLLAQYNAVAKPIDEGLRGDSYEDSLQ